MEKNVVKKVMEFLNGNIEMEVKFQNDEVEYVRIIKGQNENVLISEELLTSKINNLIREAGVPAHIKGYKYLQDSILLAYKNPKLKIKSIYSTIAEQYGTTYDSVERAIRFAIECVWKHENKDFLEKLFFYKTKKPTNLEVILSLVDHLKYN